MPSDEKRGVQRSAEVETTSQENQKVMNGVKGHTCDPSEGAVYDLRCAGCVAVHLTMVGPFVPIQAPHRPHDDVAWGPAKAWAEQHMKGHWLAEPDEPGEAESNVDAVKDWLARAFVAGRQSEAAKPGPYPTCEEEREVIANYIADHSVLLSGHVRKPWLALAEEIRMGAHWYADTNIPRRESVRNPVIDTIKGLTPEEQRTVDELSKMDEGVEAVALSTAGPKASVTWSDADERELVSGMVEERTSSASSWPGLIDDIIAYADGARRQAIEECAQLADREARICNGQKNLAKDRNRLVHTGGECIARSLAAQMREKAADSVSAESQEKTR